MADALNRYRRPRFVATSMIALVVLGIVMVPGQWEGLALAFMVFLVWGAILSDRTVKRGRTPSSPGSADGVGICSITPC